ncbi:MAG: thioredoxin [Clostridiales bacterium]|nr:thioredoxin [Clostridiales bacterium]
MTKEVTRDNFNDIVGLDKPILLDFWAQWCAPCRMLGPIVEELSNKYGDKVIIGKVNVDEQKELAQHFNVMSIPSVFIINDKQIVDNIVGVRSAKDYENAINALLEPVSKFVK